MKLPTFSAQSAFELFCHLADPRGRCNRQGLLIVAGLLLVAEIAVGGLLWLAGADLEGSTVFAFKAVCVWFAICAGSKRLHDMNLRAWWMLATLALTTLWTLVLVVAIYVTKGEHALDAGSFWYMVALAGSALPILAATLWLHFRKGHAGLNRFGATPQGLGFSGPVIDFRPITAVAHRAQLTFQRLMMPQTA